MFNATEMKVVPAYFAKNPAGDQVPFIVSLMLVDADHKPALPPAVEASINRTVEITGAEGVAFANVYDTDDLRALATSSINRARGLKGLAIVLFRCQSAPTAEQLMTVLNDSYELALVKASAARGCDE
ncbi:hypothetical protein ACQKPT_23905 [Pseudomonas monteilii]|uniref:hypothetical protein n=1 Tax=Pseudomonas monteilii TaxID=76759 RepID=UPI003D061103